MIGRHCHAKGYLSVVVGGAYEEAGDNGRRKLKAGDVVVHEAFESHADRIGRRGASIINLPLSLDDEARISSGRLQDLDQFVRMAEKRSTELLAFVIGNVRSVRPTLDWPDMLAERLRTDWRTAIADWAEQNGLAPETVSRGFRRAYDVSPKSYRATARARSAWRAIMAGEQLSDIAYTHGFSDQAHLTRDIRSLTGGPPSFWRVKSVQDRSIEAG